MLKNHISQLIQKNLGEIPTEGQKALIDIMSDYISKPVDREVLIIKGYAGTGKTTIISALVKTLENNKQRSILLAPTGRAAKVINNFSNHDAFTIHKVIYRQQSSKDGFGKFVLNKNLYSSTLFVVDEASMISNQNTENSIFVSGRLLDDLLEFVFNDKGCKLILSGDTAQLPPVGLNGSPALEAIFLKSLGFDVIEYELTDVIRQTNDSGILKNATHVRKLITKGKSCFPKLETNKFPDIRRINGSEILEELNDAYEKYGIDETITICRSNKRANAYNQGIRSQILYNENIVTKGDLLMVVKNNYFWLGNNENGEFIANGDIVEVVKIKGYQERYGFKFVDVIVIMKDGSNKVFETKLILDTLTIESAALTADQNKQLYYNVLEDYKEEKSKKKQLESIRNNTFFNALQVKYAYAVTCHKAQGGQWKAVFVDQGWFAEGDPDVEYLRWLYTAITRASEKLFLINFKNDFFIDN